MKSNYKKSGRPKLDEKEFRRSLFHMYGMEYSLVGLYIDASTKTDVRHNICGITRKVEPKNILRGKKCYNCSLSKKKDYTYIKNRIENGTNFEYELISDKYINMREKIKIKHEKCGLTFEITPNNFISLGTRCYHCSEFMKKNDPITVESLDIVKMPNLDPYIFDIRMPVTEICHLEKSISGIYIFYSEHFQILYIGKAKDLKSRLLAHINKLTHTKAYSGEFLYVGIVLLNEYKSNCDFVERDLIKNYYPKYNVNLNK